MAEQPPRVIIADNNRTNQLILELMMQRAGFEPIAVSSGAAVLDQLLVQEPIAAVLIDICMPELSGTEAIKLIRFSEASGSLAERLPIIAFTADSHSKMREECIAAGADALLTQPITSQALIETVSGLLTARENARRTPTRKVVHLKDHLGFRATSEKTVRMEVVEELYGLADLTFIRDLIKALKADSEATLSSLRRAVERGDVEGFKAGVLSLFSSSANLGATGIRAIHAYSRGLRTRHLPSAGPAVIARLEYEIGIVIDVLERFAESKMPGSARDRG
jgi:two-component system, sensor histidine kinase RpfC